MPSRPQSFASGKAPSFCRLSSIQSQAATRYRGFAGPGRGRGRPEQAEGAGRERGTRGTPGDSDGPDPFPRFLR